MRFSELAEYFQKIESTSSRNEMTEILSGLFKELDVDEIDKVLYLMQGRLTPQYVKLDFGLGEKMVIKAIAKAFSMDENACTDEVKKVGDVGIAVENIKKRLRNDEKSMLSEREVYEALHLIATEGGEGSQEAKLTHLAELIKRVDSLSARYIVRIPTGTLRLGFSDMTVLDAFSWMLTDGKSARKDIEKAFHVLPDLGRIGRYLKSEGLSGLKNIKPEPFTPIIMMKAQRLPSTQDIISKVEVGAVEPKYDGFRLQVHYRKKSKGPDGRVSQEVRLYSRGLDDVTYMYPDIVEGVKNEIIADEIIFEGEAIGFDEYSGSFLPFQETVQRKRKYDISEKAKEIPLKMFVFEILYLDGVSHLETPLKERTKLLKKSVKLYGDVFKDTILLSPEVIAEDASAIEKSFAEAIEKGLEGVMIKRLEGIYQPGARGWNWIKYKRSQSEKINDTIDCLVMGYDLGKGKRSEFGIGAFLVGIYDEDEDVFKTMAKIGTGLSDEEWKELKLQCNAIVTSHKPALYDVDKSMNVDVWVQPQLVVEIKADEITRSTMHSAGRVLQPSKSGKALEVKTQGYALRFPRLTRFRYDKKPEEVTTLKEIIDLKKQAPDKAYQ